MSNLGVRIKDSIYGDFGEKSNQGAKSFMITPKAMPSDPNCLIDRGALNSFSSAVKQPSVSAQNRATVDKFSNFRQPDFGRTIQADKDVDMDDGQDSDLCSV